MLFKKGGYLEEFQNKKVFLFSTLLFFLSVIPRDSTCGSDALSEKRQQSWDCSQAESQLLTEELLDIYFAGTHESIQSSESELTFLVFVEGI